MLSTKSESQRERERERERESYEFLGKFLYSETKRNYEINEESTTGSNKIYNVLYNMRTIDVDFDYVHVFQYIPYHSHTPTRLRYTSLHHHLVNTILQRTKVQQY